MTRNARSVHLPSLGRHRARARVGADHSTICWWRRAKGPKRRPHLCQSFASPFPLRNHLRTVLTVKGSLRRAQQRCALDGSGPFRRTSSEMRERLHLQAGRAMGPPRRHFGPFSACHRQSTYATRLSAGGVADEWVTQMLRQTDAKVFKKYSQMKLQMKREALTSLNRQAGESSGKGFDTVDHQ